MKKIDIRVVLIAVAVLLVSASVSRAHTPEGWMYVNADYSYDHTQVAWIYFSPQNTQWAVNLSTGTWVQFRRSSMAQASWSSWSLYPYVYCSKTQQWFWFANSTQWCLNLVTGVWSKLGRRVIPVGMIGIPGGTNAGTDPDFGAYHLTASSFLMDRCEVTKALWDEVRAWAVNNGYPDLPAGNGRAGNHPVHSVNWYDCVKWCNARSEKEGRTPAYYTSASRVPANIYRTGNADLEDSWVRTDVGYRLPSDTEWEYAARGGSTGQRFPWGNTIQHTRANYYSDSSFTYDTSATPGFHPTWKQGSEPYTSPVGAFPRNGYGLFDMAGNIYEWRFAWHPEFIGTKRVVCGGDWSALPGDCRVGNRESLEPVERNIFMGFRTVLPVAQP